MRGYCSAQPHVPTLYRRGRAWGVIERESGKRHRLRTLPFLNTYRTMCVSPEPGFRQVLEEIRWLDVAA